MQRQRGSGLLRSEWQVKRVGETVWGEGANCSQQAVETLSRCSAGAQRGKWS